MNNLGGRKGGRKKRGIRKRGGEIIVANGILIPSEDPGCEQSGREKGGLEIEESMAYRNIQFSC